MRFKIVLFALTLIAPLGLATSSEAALLTGTLGLNADLTLANTGDVVDATSFTFTSESILGSAGDGRRGHGQFRRIAGRHAGQ